MPAAPVAPGQPVDLQRRSKRVLEPIDRISEILFGLIMVLTFTGALSVAEAGRADVREMLIGALGCNLAWGIIDGVFYLMGVMADRGHNRATFLAVRRATDPREAQRLIADALPPVVASVLGPSEFAALHERLKGLPDSPGFARLDRHDWKGAVGVFLLVALTTFPVVLPFVFLQDIAPALRISNAIAIAFLATAGAWFGRITGRNPWAAGIGMVIFGTLLVAVTIALGG
jgi:hypothetical protein